LSRTRDQRVSSVTRQLHRRISPKKAVNLGASALSLCLLVVIGAICLTPTAITAASDTGDRVLASSNTEKPCGTREIFGQTFSVWVLGNPLSCAKARHISSVSCGVKIHRKWSCLSFRENKPFLAWLPTKELFKRHWSTTIVFRRYPCTDARVTPQLFGLPGNARVFPTRRQMLADDLIRCHMLRDEDLIQVEETVGPPDERSTSGGRISFEYGLGPERDSIVQVDNEILLVEFAQERVASVSIYQG
jgi:hypothetical protein